MYIVNKLRVTQLDLDFLSTLLRVVIVLKARSVKILLSENSLFYTHETNLYTKLTSSCTDAVSKCVRFVVVHEPNNNIAFRTTKNMFN